MGDSLLALYFVKGLKIKVAFTVFEEFLFFGEILEGRYTLKCEVLFFVVLNG